MGEVQFLAFHLRQYGIYATFLQVTEQCRMREFLYLQALETRFICLSFSDRIIDRPDMRCLPFNPFQQVRHIVGAVEFLRQGDDISALTRPEFVPMVEFGIYLERCFRFLPERGFVPKAFTLSLDGAVAQTLQIVCDAYFLCFLCSHNLPMVLMVNENR